MSTVTLKINGQEYAVDVTPDMPLLWALRDKLDLIGTKYSCGIGVCGTCTVLVNGMPMRSCVMPAATLAGAEITTTPLRSSLPVSTGKPGWFTVKHQ